MFSVLLCCSKCPLMMFCCQLKVQKVPPPVAPRKRTAGCKENELFVVINVKTKFIKDGYRWRSCTSKTAIIYRFVRFVMYCTITTCSVECYWHCRDETVHYKSNKTVNYCGFRFATTSPITVFYELCFYILYLMFFITNYVIITCLQHPVLG